MVVISQPLGLGESVVSRAREELVIPGRTNGTVHALRFYASAIPHVGLNDPPEHFLMSFERLAPRHTPPEDRARPPR